MIRTYLRDLINYHKPTVKLNNDSGAARGEQKVQLVMQNNCISVKNFENTHTIYSASKPVEMLLVDFLIQLQKDFNSKQKHQMIMEADLLINMLGYYIIIL